MHAPRDRVAKGGTVTACFGTLCCAVLCAVRVSCVSPVSCAFLNLVLGLMSDHAAVWRLPAQVPMQRAGQPSEVGGGLWPG